MRADDEELLLRHAELNFILDYYRPSVDHEDCLISCPPQGQVMSDLYIEASNKFVKRFVDQEDII